MCGSPQMPKTYQPSEAVNGTWTPTKAYTQQEQDQLMKQAEGGFTLMGVNMGEQQIKQQIADRAGVASADAAKLASMGQQAGKDPSLALQPGKAARTPLNPAATGAGGPTSLITGGTASSALTGGRKAPTSTLLGG